MNQKFAVVVAFGVLLCAGAPAFAQAGAQGLAPLVTRASASGEACLKGLAALESVDLYQRPSPALGAMFLSEPGKLAASTEFQALQPSEQASLVALAATARRCNHHLATLAALASALEAQPQGQADPAGDNQAIVQLLALHERIGAVIESATRRSPEFTHFMHVQGLPAQ